jgi:hypothetical protein
MHSNRLILNTINFFWQKIQLIYYYGVW